jgi:tetratricopeptide (TPR) repeat protein
MPRPLLARVALALKLSAPLSCSLALSGALSGCHPERAESIKLMNDGIKAFRGGNSISAIRSLELAGDVDPSNDRAFFYQGIILNDLGRDTSNNERFEAAAKALKRCTEVNAKDPEAFYQLGVAQEALGRLEEAVQAFDQAIALKGGHGEAALRKGLALLVRRRFNDAQDAFQLAIRVKPQLTEPYQALATLYMRFRQAGPAAQVLKNAIENHPTVYEFKRDLGQVYEGQGQVMSAIPLYEAAHALDPSESTLLFLLAKAYFKVSDMRSAEVYTRKFLQQGARADKLEILAAKKMLLDISKTKSTGSN